MTALRYVLTEDELRSLIGNAWEAGETYGNDDVRQWPLRNCSEYVAWQMDYV